MHKTKFNILKLLSFFILTSFSFNRAYENLYGSDDEFYDILNNYFNNPINLNNTNSDELKYLKLTEEQINNLFFHIAKCGPLLSIYELQVIPKWDINTIKTILPFVFIDEIYPSPNDFNHVKNKKSRKIHFTIRYSRVFEKTAGYLIDDNNETPYLGDPNKIQIKLVIKNNENCNYGFTLVKNDGEQFIFDTSTKRYFFNYWSSFIQIYNQGIFKNTIIGDFKVGSGQSLVFNSGFGFGKPYDAISIMKTNNNRLSPNCSFSSSGFSGIATRMEYNNIDFTLFYSYSLLHASIENDIVSSWSKYQITRTINDLNKKNKLGEHVIGSVLSYNINDQSEIGLNFVLTNFSNEIEPKNDLEYKFKGKENYNIGLFNKLLYRNFNIFSELATCKNNSFAGIIGTIINLSSIFDITLLTYYYSPTYFNFYGNPLRYNSPNNEYGFRFGSLLSLTYYSKLSGSIGYFCNPKETFKNDFSINGYEYDIIFSHSFSRYHNMIIKFRNKKKYNKSINEILNNKYNLKFNVKNIFDYLQLNSQMIINKFVSEESKYGFGISETITFTQLKPYILSGFVEYLNIDNDTKLCLFEKNVLFANYFKMFNFPQFKTGIILGYKAKNGFRFECKYSCIYALKDNNEKNDDITIGSGLNEIKDNVKNEISFQIMLI